MYEKIMGFKKIGSDERSSKYWRDFRFFTKTITYPESRRFKLLFKLIKS